MSLTSLLPIGGAALGLLAGRTLSGLSSGLASGLSFSSALTGSLSGSSPAGTPAVEDDSIPDVDLDTIIPQFAARLRDRLRATGLDTSQPITLKPDGNGGILVDGDHPDRATIEALLEQDSQLSAQFAELVTEAVARRQQSSTVADDAFGEFRLSIAGSAASIHFE